MNEPPGRGETRWRIAAAAWLMIVAWTTLRSLPDQQQVVAGLPWYCVVCGDSGVTDVLLNILLFAPLGMALHALRWPLRRTVVILALLSIGIELVQGGFLVGRDASLGDVLSNSSGGLLGWLIYPGLILLTRPPARVARRSAAILVALMVLVWWTTTMAFRPALTGPAPWWGQLLHVFPGDPLPFPGTLQQATINGADVPDGPMQQQQHLDDSLAVEVDATRSTSQSFGTGISLLRIVDRDSNAQVAISQDGRDARLRLRLRASDWLLHPARWLVPDGLAIRAATPWRFRAAWTHDAVVVTSGAIGGTDSTVVSMPISIGEGWIFVHPFVGKIGPREWLWTVLWLAMWFGALGWLAGFTANREMAALIVVAVGSFAAIGAASGLAVRPGEIAAATGSAVALAALARRRQRNRRPAESG